MTELAGPARLRTGDCVLADIGCYLDGYRGEFARTLAIGEPSAALLRAHDAVREALESAEETLADGVPAAARRRRRPRAPARRSATRPARCPTRSATAWAPRAASRRPSRPAPPT